MSLIDGWLWKKGEKGLVKSFKKRFFRVIADRILYAEDPSKLATAPAGFIDMSTVTSFVLNDTHTSKKLPGKGFEIVTNTGRVYILVAEIEADLKKWQTYVENFLASTSSVIEPEHDEPSLLDLINNGKGQNVIAGENASAPGSPLSSTGPQGNADRDVRFREDLLSSANTNKQRKATGAPTRGINNKEEEVKKEDLLSSSEADPGKTAPKPTSSATPGRETMIRFADDLEKVTWSQLDGSRNNSTASRAAEPPTQSEIKGSEITWISESVINPTNPAKTEKIQEEDEDDQEKEDKRRATQELGKIQTSLLEQQLRESKKENDTLIRSNEQLSIKLQEAQAKSSQQIEKAQYDMIKRDHDLLKEKLRAAPASGSDTNTEALKLEAENSKQKLASVSKELADLKATSYVSKYKEVSEGFELLKKDNERLKDKLRSVSDEAGKVTGLEIKVSSLSKQLAQLEKDYEAKVKSESLAVAVLNSLSIDIGNSIPELKIEEPAMAVPVIMIDGPEVTEHSIVTIARRLTTQMKKLPSAKVSDESLRKSKELDTISEVKTGTEKPSESLAVQLATKDAEITALKIELEAKSNEMEAIKKEVKDVLGDSMKTDNEIEENMEVLHATIESLKSELAVKESQLSDAADNIEKLKVEVKFGGNSLSDADLKVTIEQLRNDLKEKEKKLKESEEVAAKYLEEKQQLDKRVLRVTEKVQEWNEQRKKDAELIEKMKKQLEEETQKAQTQVQKSKADLAESSAKTSEIEKLKAEVLFLKSGPVSTSSGIPTDATVSLLKAELDAAKKTISDNDQFLKLAKSSEQENAETVAVYEEEVKKLQTKISSLEAELKNPKALGSSVPSIAITVAPSAAIAVPSVESDDFVGQFREIAKLSEKAKLDLLGLKEQFEILSKKHANLMERSETNAESLKNKDEQLLAASTLVRELRAKLGPEGAAEKTQKLQKLVDQLAAHQSQNAYLTENVQQMEQKLKIESEARDTRLTQILFDIAHWREKYTDLMNKMLKKEGISPEYMKDADHSKRELFFSLAREIKMNFAIRGQQIQVDIAQLYDAAKQGNVPWKEWDLWIKGQMKDIIAGARPRSTSGGSSGLPPVTPQKKF